MRLKCGLDGVPDLLGLASSFICDDEEFIPHVKAFLLALEGYSRLKPRVHTVEQIVGFAATGPEGAKYLKDYREYAFRNHIEAQAKLEAPRGFKMGETKYFGYSSIFPERYMIHWIESCSDIREFAFRPVKDLGTKLRFEFLRAAASVLDEVEGDLNLDVETLYMNTGGSRSRIFSPEDETFERLDLFQALDRYNPLTVANQIVAEEVVVQVGPANCRDTTVADVRSRNSISVISRLLRPILRQLSASAMGLPEPELVEKIYEFKARNRVYLSRDFEKEGLTKPPMTIIWLMEALKRRWPKCEHLDLLQIYSEVRVLMLDTRKLEKLTRGHGLGFANEITTLLQIILFEIVTDRLAEESSVSADALFFNDDAVIGFPTDALEIDIMDYEEAESTVFTEYDFIRKDKKTYYSQRGFKFLELYFDNYKIDPKSSLSEICFQRAKMCVNVTHAKSYVGSIFYEGSERLVDELSAFWGYEFFKEETTLPREIGGWISKYESGTNRLLSVILDLDPELVGKADAALGAYSALYRDKISDKTLYKHPIVKAFNLKIDRMLPGFIEFVQRKSMNLRNLSDNDFIRWWDKVSNLRRRTFASYNYDQKPRIDVINHALTKINTNFHIDQRLVEEEGDLVERDRWYIESLVEMDRPVSKYLNSLSEWPWQIKGVRADPYPFEHQKRWKISTTANPELGEWIQETSLRRWYLLTQERPVAASVEILDDRILNFGKDPDFILQAYYLEYGIYPIKLIEGVCPKEENILPWINGKEASLREIYDLLNHGVDIATYELLGPLEVTLEEMADAIEQAWIELEPEEPPEPVHVPNEQEILDRMAAQAIIDRTLDIYERTRLFGPQNELLQYEPIPEEVYEKVKIHNWRSIMDNQYTLIEYLDDPLGLKGLYDFMLSKHYLSGGGSEEIKIRQINAGTYVEKVDHALERALARIEELKRSTDSELREVGENLHAVLYPVELDMSDAFDMFGES